MKAYYIIFDDGFEVEIEAESQSSAWSQFFLTYPEWQDEENLEIKEGDEVEE